MGASLPNGAAAPADATPPVPAAIDLTLDGRPVQARPGETLWALAARLGTPIPHLCHRPDEPGQAAGLRPEGNCRACVVEVAGERTLAASCCRAAAPGMTVSTGSERAVRARRMVLELLSADAGAASAGATADSELLRWAAAEGVSEVREGLRRPPAAAPATTHHGAPADAAPHHASSRPARDTSHPAITVDHDACILCTRCVRACRDEQGNDVIGLGGRGAATRISFDADAPLGASSCVGCGECVQACPTGALAPAGGVALTPKVKAVDSVCPFCGVGCQLTWHVGRNAQGAERIEMVTGRDGPANRGRLCVKGRYGFDYVHHPERLTVPLVRRAGVPKDPADIERHRRGELPLDALFRPAGWDEALDLAAGGLRRLRDATPPGAPARLAGFGSAKGSNEEAYLFQKLVRQGLATHNVDHCTRLCHASSVAALLEGIGSGSVSNPVMDVRHARFILLIGANPSVNHPVAASWIRNAVDREGATLCIADPRGQALSRRARWHLRFRPGSDVALLNALLHVILEEGLVDEAFLAARVHGLAALRESVREATPERMAELCGIAPDTLREVARAYATSPASMILWGMGVSQHVHGTDNARALIALAMVTGQIGRPGTGLHPLRGQNNVQGASDAGLIPMMLPGYRRVGDGAARALFEQLWGGAPLGEQPGKTVVEIMHAARAGEVRGMLIEGENPAMSDPDLQHARAALASLEHLVVQDLFATETALLADVILPGSAHAEKWGSYTNTDRLVQVGRPAVAPPGDARQDLWILEQLGRRLGLPWNYWRAEDDCAATPHGHAAAEPGLPAAAPGHAAAEAPVARVFEEMRQGLTPLAGLPWSRLVRENAVMTPVAAEDQPGRPVVFIERFPTADGRATLVPTTWRAGPEHVDAEFPFVLTTGRVLEHWHTGAMTRHAPLLDALAPWPLVSMHPEDAAPRGLREGDAVELATRHGAVRAVASLTPDLRRGQLFLAFAYWEAAANVLTGDALDPVAKIPGFKVTAATLKPVPRDGVPPTA